MSYLEQQDLEVMDWPPQSIVLNPIEKLWKTLGVKVFGKKSYQYGRSLDETSGGMGENY